MGILLRVIWISGGCLVAGVIAIITAMMLAMFSQDMSAVMFYGTGLFGYAAGAVGITTIVFVTATLAYGILRLLGCR